MEGRRGAKIALPLCSGMERKRGILASLILLVLHRSEKTGELRILHDILATIYFTCPGN